MKNLSEKFYNCISYIKNNRFVYQDASPEVKTAQPAEIENPYYTYDDLDHETKEFIDRHLARKKQRFEKMGWDKTEIDKAVNMSKNAMVKEYFKSQKDFKKIFSKGETTYNKAIEDTTKLS